ncbi:MAG: C25 family cysteine peptidase, partial [Bacteroidetes bacterium]|nr:C25 family cysteine peptidase [Bacteroidota bacterium]
MYKPLLNRLLFFILIAVTTGVFAQNQLLRTRANSETQNEVVLMSQNDNETTIRFELNEIELVEVDTDYGKAFVLTSGKAPLILEKGTPEMFYLTSTLIIPDQGGTELEISYSNFRDFENIEIAPSKGNLPRNIDPQSVPYTKGDVYSQNKFYPENIVRMREPFIMRDVRGQSVDVYPVQYNPVTKVLRIYSDITVTVRHTTAHGINEFTHQKRHQSIEPQFDEMYKSLFINSSVFQGRGYPTEEAGEILIICYPAFMNAMKPYVDWKRTIGRKTTLVSTAETGTTGAAIKAYIQNYYNNPANNLAYILLVGDAAQIPTLGTSEVSSDIEYAKLAGNDNFIEALIGRMSAETVAHVQTQVERTINYERNLTTTDTWIGKAIGLAHNEGLGSGHDGGEADYQHINNIRTRLLTYGYNPVYQEYTGNCPGVPYTTIAQISQRFNDGVGIANYCNHGTQTAWTFGDWTTTYSNTEVNQLQNMGKLPFIFSVACRNGHFTFSQPCFAETWLRATQNNQPTGAINTFMSTIVLSWVPPMTAQDEFVNICIDLPSQYSGQQPGIKRTFAGAALNATQKMIMVHGSDAIEDYNSWTVFGDPSLMIRTKTPQEMTVFHLPIIYIGTNEFSVNCDANGATVAMSTIVDNEVVILGTGVVNGGIANITLFEPIATPCDITIAITARDKVTYLGEISAIPLSGPYIVPTGYAVVGNDEKLTYISTNAGIEVTLNNVGIEVTNRLTVTIACADPQLTINNGTATCNGITPNGSTTVNFTVTVAHEILDNKSFFLDVTVTENGKSRVWKNKLPIKAYAPKFSLESVMVNDVEGGNLTAGTVAAIKTVVKNVGGADAYKVKGDLEILSPYITFACEGQTNAGKNLPAGESINIPFIVIIDSDMPCGYTANLNLSLSAQYDRTDTKEFTLSNSGSSAYCLSGTQDCSEGDKFTSVILYKTSTPATLLINNTNSTCSTNGYQDYTSTVVSLEPGQQYTIKVKCGYETQQVGGWFDMNGNNTFDSNEKLITLTCPSANTEYTQTFTIPTEMGSGTYRFRLITKYNAAPIACDNNSYGQTHDYTIVLPNLYPQVQNVVAVLNEENQAITITWNAPT